MLKLLQNSNALLQNGSTTSIIRMLLLLHESYWYIQTSLDLVGHPVLVGPDVVASLFVAKRVGQLLGGGGTDPTQTVEHQVALLQRLGEAKALLKVLLGHVQGTRGGLEWDVQGTRDVALLELDWLSDVNQDGFLVLFWVQHELLDVVVLPYFGDQL